MSRVSSCAARLISIAIVMLCALAAGTAFAGDHVGSVNFTVGAKRLTGDWPPQTLRSDADPDTVSPSSLQPALGVELAWGRPGWPVMVALDVLHSYDDGVQRYRSYQVTLPPPATPPNNVRQFPVADVRRRVSTLEIGLGARRAFNAKGLSPYLGAGIAWVRVNRISQMSDPSQGFGAPGLEVRGRHNALGVWVGGGVFRRIGPRFQMGLTGRYSRAKMEFAERGEVHRTLGGYSFASAPAGSKIEAGGRHIGLVVGWSFPGRK